jgi:hypothetical protein
MKYNYFYRLIAVVTFSLLYSCEQRPENLSSATDDLDTNNPIGSSFSLVIDEKTSLFNFLNAQTVQSDGSNYLIFNNNLNSVDQYSLLSGQMEKRIIFPQEGPNSIPLMQIPYGFHYVNADTLIFFSGLLETLYLANLEGEVYREIELSGQAVGFGSVGTTSPIAYRKGEVYMQTLPHIPINKPNGYKAPLSGIAKINLRNGKYIELQLPHPKAYENMDIAQQLKMVDLVYNSKSDRFIINFQLSDELLVTDFMNSYEWVSAKSTLVKEIIETDRSNAIVDASKLQNLYYWMNSGYEKIIYEPVRDIYVREARSGISDQAYINRKLSSERELLILNSDFEVIKKQKFISHEMIYHFFLDDSFYWNKDIQTYNIETGVEDSLYFNQTKVSEK